MLCHLSSPEVCWGLIAFSFLPDTVIHLVIMLSCGAWILMAERLSPFIRLLIIEIKENWQQLQDSRRQVDEVREWHLPPFNHENGGWIKSAAGAWRKAAYFQISLADWVETQTDTSVSKKKKTCRFTVYTLLCLFKSLLFISQTINWLKPDSISLTSCVYFLLACCFSVENNICTLDIKQLDDKIMFHSLFASLSQLNLVV